MAARRIDKENTARRSRPAMTVEGRENQLVALAVDLAEQQMRAGTASSQVISHYLKLGTTREKLEQEKLAGENKLLQAKIEQLQSTVKSEEMFAQALKAMSTYSGRDDEDDYED